MSIICVYHSADTDGRVSAGIVKQAFSDDFVEFVPANYGLNTKLNLTPDTTVVIVDYSFDLDIMKDIQKQVKKFIWIDHHPVINQYKEQGFNPDGLRETEHSAAYYCWKYFFPDKKVPDYVRYTSDYDTWAHKLPESMAFNAAMYNEPILNINSYGWSRLEDKDYMAYLLNNGNKILSFNELKHQVVRPHIFSTEFMGYKTIAVNMRNTNSTIFNNCGLESEIMMTFGQYSNMHDPRVTLYSTNNVVDVGKIAEGLGGGGHAGAAGFTISWDMLPLCPKTNFTMEYYLKPLDDICTQDDYIREYYQKECVRVYKSLGTRSNLLGHEVVSINHPLWSPSGWQEDNVVVWSFIHGQYLYRAYAIDQSFRDIITSTYHNTKMPDGGLWFLSDKLLFSKTV